MFVYNPIYLKGVLVQPFQILLRIIISLFKFLFLLRISVLVHAHLNHSVVILFLIRVKDRVDTLNFICEGEHLKHDYFLHFLINLLLHTINLIKFQFFLLIFYSFLFFILSMGNIIQKVKDRLK